MTPLALALHLALAQAADAPMRSGLSHEEVDVALYSLGVQLGRSLEPFALTDEELAMVVAGMKDQMHDTVHADVDVNSSRVRELEISRREKRMANEKAKGRQYVARLLAEKKAEGLKQEASGLVYMVVNEGVGPSPTSVDTVKVHYRGTLVDGREFDSSFRRGEPATFPLNAVISCWTEAVQKMKAGGRAKVVCPSSIAYGDRGQGTTIPPGATLLFDIELLDVTRRGSTTVK